MMTVEFKIRLFDVMPVLAHENPKYELNAEITGVDLEDCRTKFLQHIGVNYAAQLEECEFTDMYYNKAGKWEPMVIIPPATSSTVAINQDSTIE